jgi:nucleotide-binding universal stress UspA family protein
MRNVATDRDGPRVAQYTNVLVPLDGSEFADAAIRTAQVLAARFDAALHTVSVAVDADDARALSEHVGAVVGSFDEDRNAVIVGVDPVAAIERRRDLLGNCLVCLSTHGRGRVSGAVIGSVARELLQGSPAPLVAVGPMADRRASFADRWPEPLTVPRLVACVDGSAASETVLPAAAGWANALGMRMSIVTVASPVPAPVRPDDTVNRRIGPDGDAEHYVAELARRWVDEVTDVTGEVVYDPVSAADGIAAHLRQDPPGLVAVTTHARTGLRRLLLGATAAAIVGMSVVPTLVIPLAIET